MIGMGDVINTLICAIPPAGVISLETGRVVSGA